MKTIYLFLGALLFSFSLQAASSTGLNNDKLSDDIVYVLKKHYSSVEVRKWSGYMAAQVSTGATDYDSLNHNLINLFSMSDTNLANPNKNIIWLDWANNSSRLKNMASTIALMEYPDKAPAAAAVDSAVKKLNAATESVQHAAAAAQVSPPSTPPPRGSAREPFAAPSGTGALPPIVPAPPETVQAQGANGGVPPSASLAANVEMSQNLNAAANNFASASAQFNAAAQSLADTIGKQPPVTGDAAKTNNVYGQVSLWTGAKLSNPYMISSNKLSSGGTSSDGYIEINLSSRYVLRQGDDASDLVWNDKFKTPEDGYVHWVWPILHWPDIDTRFGYLFRGTTAPTNYTASTIAGTADFYSETSIGLPILRYVSDDSYWKQQVSIELGGGFATDKTHLDLHPDFFAGLGWQGSFFINSTNQGYWIGRVGYAMLDQPVLIGGTNTVQLNSLSQPQFTWKGAPSIGVIVTYPLSSSISLQVGANAYFTQNPPTSWNATVGATLDLSKFFSSILK